MGRRGPRPDRLMPLTWTPELAYVTGLMASDGCLASDGRHLNLTSKDVDQLETFKKCLGIKANLSWKPSSTSKNLYPQLQFGDVVLYRWFVSIGITPRKSKTLGAVAVPDNYFFDYLRGEFDGDGSSHAYWDARWRSSVSLYINFASASQQHLEWLKETINRLIGVSGIIKPGGTALCLQFSKAKAWQLYQALYYSKNIPYLARKKEKLDRQWEAAELARQGKYPAILLRGGPVLRIT